MESYLRFQVSGVAGTVRSAKLRLYDTDNSTVDGPAAYGTSSSWTETGITMVEPAGAHVGPARRQGRDRGRLLCGVGRDAARDRQRGVLVRARDHGDDGANFASREHATATQRPQLIVTYTPQEDIAPPTPPTLTGQAVSATRVDLSWSGATDDIGVTGYEIYRNGALVATLGNVTLVCRHRAHAGHHLLVHGARPGRRRQAV